MDKEKINNNLFLRLFIFVGIGIFSGIIGGFVCGLIGSFFFWVNAKALLPELYKNYSFSSLIFPDAYFEGIPLGLLIGFATGLHHAVFKQNSPKAIVWAIISGLGTVSGLWFSHFTNNNLFAYIFEITFIGLMVGLLTHWLINKIFNLYAKGTMRKFFLVLSPIMGLLFIFLPIYSYFRISLSLMNIPS